MRAMLAMVEHAAITPALIWTALIAGAGGFLTGLAEGKRIKRKRSRCR